MTDASAGFVETLLRETEAIAARFSDAITDAAMVSIEQTTSKHGRPLSRVDLRSAIRAGISGYLTGEIDGWRQRVLKWRYDGQRGRLHVTSANLDLKSLRQIINKGAIPNEVKVIIYETPTCIFIITGRYIRGWLSGHLED